MGFFGWKTTKFLMILTQTGSFRKKYIPLWFPSLWAKTLKLWVCHTPQKNRKFSKKNFYKSVISFLNMARKKSFFLKNFQAQISTQILKMSLFAGRSNFEKNFSEIFFHSYNIDIRTTCERCERVPTTFWHCERAYFTHTWNLAEHRGELTLQSACIQKCIKLQGWTS